MGDKHLDVAIAHPLSFEENTRSVLGNKSVYGPSGNRTRVLGSEAQEDIRYPMDPSRHLES